MITITSLFVMLFSSVSGYARVKWNEYHEEIIYFNYEGQNIVLKDLPSLPLDELKRVDIRDIQSSFVISLGQVSSAILDSLLRREMNLRNQYYHLFLEFYPRYPDTYPHGDSLVFKLFDKRIEIKNGVDSYLVCALDFNGDSTLFLINLRNGYLQSILQVSGRVSIEKKDALTATIQGDKIGLYENGYRSMVNVQRYVCNQPRLLSEFRINDNGELSLIKNYSLLYSNRRFAQEAFDFNREKWESDTLKYANYDKEDIILSNSPICQVAHGKSIDIKTIVSTPTCPLSKEEAAIIGPAVCRENWTENTFYWLNQIHCVDSVKSYSVLVVGIGGRRPSRIFMVNLKGHRLTSVVKVSSIGSKRELFSHTYSSYYRGIVTIFNDYGEQAVSPIKVFRDYTGPSGVLEDTAPTDIDEKYDVIHDFNLYETNMPKSSKYVLKLDKDGFVTRQ